MSVCRSKKPKKLIKSSMTLRLEAKCSVASMQISTSRAQVTESSFWGGETSHVCLAPIRTLPTLLCYCTARLVLRPSQPANKGVCVVRDALTIEQIDGLMSDASQRKKAKKSALNSVLFLNTNENRPLGQGCMTMPSPEWPLFGDRIRGKLRA